MTIELNPITSGYSTGLINDNFQAIEDYVNDKLLQRDGVETGEVNQMEVDLDMNSHFVYNLPEPVLEHQAARLKDVQNAIAGGNSANLISFTPYSTISSTNVQAAIQEIVDEVGSIETTTSTGTQPLAEALDLRVIYKDSKADLDLISPSSLTNGQSALVQGSEFRWDGSVWNAVGAVSVRAFGAVGDGVTDDTAAIQAALDSSYRHIYLPFTHKITGTLLSTLPGRLITCDGEIVSDTAELKVLRVTGDKSEIQINITADGTSITDGVHIDNADGCIVRNCRIVGLTFKDQISASIRADTRGGVSIFDNWIEGLFDPVDNPGTPGGANEVARAIVLAGTDTALVPSIISNNYIKGSFDPRTSSIQILFDRGVDPLFADAKCLIKGNTIFDFNRRGIKVQASGVSIRDNYLKSTFTNSQLLQPSNAMDLQYCENVEVSGNTVVCDSLQSISVTGDDGRICEDVTITNNYFERFNSSTGPTATLFRAKGIVFHGNRIHRGAPGMLIGFLTDSMVSSVTFTGDGAGTGSDLYCVSHNTTERTIFKDIHHPSGNRSRVFAVNHNTIINNVYEGIYSNADVAVIVSTSAQNNIVRNVVDFSGNPPVSGDKSTFRMRDLTSTSSESQVGTLYFTEASPQTETPSLFYSRGDFALSLSPSSGTPMGWACTVSGTPGTWEPLANVT